MTELSPRELATVLASLRYFQQELIRDEATGGDGPISLHFDEHEPLAVAEINELCERLNLGD
ncbi:MAG: hypothetical protein AB7I37_12155 [Pirellulales bacterium]